MKNFGCLMVLGLIASVVQGQMLKKVPVSNSGCSVYTYCVFEFEKEYSQDSSLVYVSECIKDDVGYGVICVKLLQPATDLDKAEDMLVDYLDYLKKSFGITKAVGYGRGNHLANNDNTRGVIDYWEDKEKNNWKVKAWTDGKFLAVLYGYSAKELPQPKLDVFLESFKFPGM